MFPEALFFLKLPVSFYNQSRAMSASLSQGQAWSKCWVDSGTTPRLRSHFQLFMNRILECSHERKVSGLGVIRSRLCFSHKIWFCWHPQALTCASDFWLSVIESVPVNLRLRFSTPKNTNALFGLGVNLPQSKEFNSLGLLFTSASVSHNEGTEPKSEALDYCFIYIPVPTCGHVMWIMMERVTEMDFLCKGFQSLLLEETQGQTQNSDGSFTFMEHLRCSLEDFHLSLLNQGQHSKQCYMIKTKQPYKCYLATG